MKMKNTKSLTSVILAVTLSYSLPVLARNELMEANFGEPNMQDTNVVDINLAKFAALQYADKFYGNDYSALQVYNVETYYDLVNQPAVYAITLTSTEGQIPILEELRTEVQHKYSAIKQLKESLLLIDSEPISGKAKSKLTSGVRIQIKELEKQLRQSDRFITILCGATEQHVPVIRAYRGLPEHITSLPHIQDKIISTPELSNLRPLRVYYLGIFDHRYSLELSGENKERVEIDATSVDSDQKLIHLRSTKVSSMSEIQERINEKKAIRNAKKLQMSQEEQQLMIAKEEGKGNRIKEKWLRIKKLYERQKHVQISDPSASVKQAATEESVPIPDKPKEINISKPDGKR